jgi:hypothetical protein
MKKADSDIAIRGPFMFPCLYCGKQALTGPAYPEGGEVVVHLNPKCSKFEAMSADEFVAEARRVYITEPPS